MRIFENKGERGICGHKGEMCKEDGECYFTVSFVIFSVQETHKILIRKVKGKEFFVEKRATGTEINWAIEFVVVCRVLKVEGGAYVFAIKIMEFPYSLVWNDTWNCVR